MYQMALHHEPNDPMSLRHEKHVEKYEYLTYDIMEKSPIKE